MSKNQVEQALIALLSQYSLRDIINGLKEVFGSEIIKKILDE